MQTKYLISVSQTQKKFSKNFHFGLQSNVKGNWEQLIVVTNSLKVEYLGLSSVLCGPGWRWVWLPQADIKRYFPTSTELP